MKYWIYTLCNVLLLIGALSGVLGSTELSIRMEVSALWVFYLYHMTQDLKRK